MDLRRYTENLSPKVSDVALTESLKSCRNITLRLLCPTTHKRSHEATNTSGYANNILDRKFKADKPNQKWVSDTTFIGTKEGWLYLAVIMDLYSRKIIGWSMSKKNNTAFVTNALKNGNQEQVKR